jgi:N-acetyl-anhydromuramyl-L-alanine amidase AmpD
MIIDETTYELSENNYIKSETIKKQIVIAHTSTSDMLHMVKWKNRLNGRYNKTAAFTINAAGNIYRHFDPIYTSNFFEHPEFNKKTIVILLENEGWLLKDVEKNEFINWIGHIYNRIDAVYEKRWRGYTYWAPYTKEQFDSTLELCKMLCEEFYIPKVAVSHNTKLDNINNLEGVIYRSNLEKYHTDLSPAWKCEEFKYKFENK